MAFEIVKEKLCRVEAQQRRLEALKSNDVEEYAALVCQAKGGRLQELLRQTDMILEDIMRRLGIRPKLLSNDDAVASSETLLLPVRLNIIQHPGSHAYCFRHLEHVYVGMKVRLMMCLGAAIGSGNG